MTTVDIKINNSLFHFILKDIKKNTRTVKNFSFKNKKYEISR